MPTVTVFCLFLDADLTRENVLMRSIREESQSSEDSGKENVASQANQIVSQSVPSQSTFYNSVCDSTVSQSQLSQVSVTV